MLELLAPVAVSAVVLCPSIDATKARELARNKTGYTGFAVESLYDAFMATTPRIGLWLDSSALTPEETVERILKEAAS